MSEPALLADYIDRQADEILAVWRATVDRVGDVPEAENLSYSEFVDHIPALLDRIAERLRGQPADPGTAAKKHGSVRWRQGYDIAEIVSEYGHLRSALSRATVSFAAENNWDVDRLEAANEAINDVLFEAIAESVRQFQIDSREETQAALAEVKRRQALLKDAWFSARSEQTKLRTILSSLPAAVWVVDSAGFVVAVNSEAERLEEHTALIGKRWLEHYRNQRDHRVLGSDGSDFVPESLAASRALSGATISQEEVTLESGHSRTTLSVNAAPLLDDQRAVVGAVVVALDITARKELEASLAASESRFRAIAENSPTIIWRIDVDGRCDYVNQTYLDFRGRALEDEICDGSVAGIHADDREPFLGAFRRAFDSRKPFEHTIRLVRRDGEARWMTACGTPHVDPGGGFLGYLVSLVDITARLELERILEEQWAKAEQSSRHKSRVVTALSHDARTPLNAVVLAAELLEVHLNSDSDDEVQECLKTIRHSVRNLLDLLGDLLNLSKIDAGALPTEISRFPIEPMLAECLASIEAQARVKGLAVRLEFGELVGASLETDRSKLKQVLCNFLSNALRYTEKGSIALRAERSAERISIAVQDTGIGIDPRDQARIFEEFTMLDRQRGQGREGTGLGLAICRRLARLLNGEITLQSVPGAGSRFTLHLPAAILTTAPAPPSKRADAAPAPSGTVLIAEDHPDSRQTLGKVLRRMGYRVLEADNGRDALAIARSEPVMAILMDVNMPLMDGVEATEAIRADETIKHLPIFALTGDVTPENRRRIGEAGVDGYLEKPVTWESLQAALGSLASRSREQ